MFGNPRRKRTNTFSFRTSEGALSGRLKRNGDLDLLIDGVLFLTVPGNMIPALAHWLSSVKGRFADVDPDKLIANAVVVPIK